MTYEERPVGFFGGELKVLRNRVEDVQEDLFNIQLDIVL